MKDMIRMVVVLSVLCALSGFALSYLKMATATRIEDQVLTYVQGPALARVFAGAENSPIADRRKFVADGREVTVFPCIVGGVLKGVAIEDRGRGYGGEIGVMVGFNVDNDSLAGIGVTTLKETPGLGMRVTEAGFSDQFAGARTPVALTAQGGGIDAVSGATISSTGVTVAVNGAAKTYARLKAELLAAWAKK